MTTSSPLIAGMLLRVSTNSSNPAIPDGFISEVTNEPVDPNVVQLKVSVNGGAPTTYTYGSGPTIVRDGTGLYHANLDSTGLAGTWTVEWIGDPDGTPVQVCQAVIASTFSVESAPL